MTPEERARQVVKFHEGEIVPRFHNVICQSIASAIREAVEAEREACVAPLEAELKRFDMVRHGTRKLRDLGIEWALNTIRSRSDKPAVTPKEGA